VRVACHGAAGSRNAGLAVTRTPYVTFLDDDDLWVAGNMEAQLAALEGNPHAGFAYGIAQSVTDDLEVPIGRFPEAPLPSGRVPEKLHKSYPQLGVVLFRSEAVAQAGGFDSRIRYYEDADLMARIAAKHEIVGVEFVGMLYRERGPSRERSDYFWADARREVTRWRPKQLGVPWITGAEARFARKGLFYRRFCDDAAACAALGHRQDTLVCLARAVRISPAHALRHSSTLGSILWQCTRGRTASRAPVTTR
jgi:hypothetical protein